jgi:membrane fusion protein (multidrug efflux system)
MPGPGYLDDAVRHHTSVDRAGSPLRLSPRWADACYWIIVAAIAVALLYACFGSVHDYASGPAVVRFVGRTDVTSRAGGAVMQVLVEPGQRVKAGAPLLRFDDASERSEFEERTREFDRQLLRILRDPAAAAARDELAALKTARDLAQTRRDERWVRAPVAGIVGSLRVRAGQYIEAGDLLATLLGESARPEVAALLPGQHRPRMRPGMRLRLELSGFPHAYQELTVTAISAQLVGPTEVRRFLGPDSGDAVNVAGPLVVVEAALPERTFWADRQPYEYCDGMLASANVQLESRSILRTLIPALELLFDDQPEARPPAP